MPDDQEVLVCMTCIYDMHACTQAKRMRTCSPRRYKYFRTRVGDITRLHSTELNSGDIVKERAGSRGPSALTPNKADNADNALTTELWLEKRRNARLHALIPPWNAKEAARVSALSITLT